MTWMFECFLSNDGEMLFLPPTSLLLFSWKAGNVGKHRKWKVTLTVVEMENSSP